MRVRLMTSSPTVFIMRSRRSSAIRTDFVLALGAEPACRQLCVNDRLVVAAATSISVADASERDSFVLFGLERRELGDTAEQRIDTVAHFGFIGPLVVQSFLEDVDGFKANVNDGRRGFDLAVAQAADQIFYSMSDGAEAFETDLRSGAFHRVNGAEKAIDLFGIVITFERNQAIADDLKMFLRFRAKEFENFGTDFVVE